MNHWIRFNVVHVNCSSFILLISCDANNSTSCTGKHGLPWNSKIDMGFTSCTVDEWLYWTVIDVLIVSWSYLITYQVTSLQFTQHLSVYFHASCLAFAVSKCLQLEQVSFISIQVIGMIVGITLLLSKSNVCFVIFAFECSFFF